MIKLINIYEQDLNEVAVAQPNSMAIQRFANLGDMAEAILGAAIVAKFKEPNKQISNSDVLAMISNLPKITKNYTQKVVQQVIRTKSVKNDEIIFTIGLATINYMSLQNKDELQRAGGIIGSAAMFANSEEIQSYALKAYNDPKKNIISISSIGTENQKGTKVDLKIDYDGQLIPWGKISLKAGGTKQLGQIGKGWEAGQKASRGIVDLFKGLFGITLDPSLKNMYTTAIATGTYDDAVEAIKEVYWDAYQKISNRFDGGEEELVQFLKTLANGIKYEAYLDEEDIILVNLGNNSFKALNFNKLIELFNDPDIQIEIEANYNSEGKVPALYMNIWVNDKYYGPLVTVRPKIRINEKTGGIGEFRHYVEKESGLNNLINLVK